MTPRERVLTTLKRKIPDKAPREVSWGAFTPSLMKTFREKTGADDPAEYFNFEVRSVVPAPTRKTGNFNSYYGSYTSKLLEKGKHDEMWGMLAEWGIVAVKGSRYHFSKILHPMANLRHPKEILNYPFPDLKESYRYTHIPDEVEKLKKRELAVMGELVVTIFELSWYLRGMENLLTDFMVNEKIANTLLDVITDIRCFQTEKFAQAGVDILRLGDDVGSQKRMIMSPELWRKYLKPRLRKVIQIAKRVNPDIHIFYHSDGYIEPIIPDLIQIGVDILNPIQPECMDPAKLKHQYGNKLSFWGTIGCQKTMPFGSPEDVKQEVKLRMQTVGQGGGLLLAPTHILEPEVPWENVLAFFEAVEKYGRYRN